jgi:hypothetical protein
VARTIEREKTSDGIAISSIGSQPDAYGQITVGHVTPPNPDYPTRLRSRRRRMARSCALAR